MHSYLITSKEFYTDTIEEFSSILRRQLLKHKPDFVLYRDKTNPHYKMQAAEFLKVCSEFEAVRAFLHGDVDLASKLNARGVHLTSTMFEKIKKAKELGLEVIMSTHTHQEVLEAQKEGVDYVTYSPIFSTPNKGEPKGLKDLENLLQKTDMKIFALGGIISQEQVSAIERTSAFGFASIRYFY
jgi:thiamine-phosphate pyrophosphorylase